MKRLLERAAAALAAEVRDRPARPAAAGTRCRVGNVVVGTPVIRCRCDAVVVTILNVEPGG